MNQFKSELTHAFFDHWCKLRKDGAIPATEDYFDNMEPRIAPFIFMFEHFDDDIIVRYQGTHIVARWGIDITGQSWLAHNPYLSKSLVLANSHDSIAYRCGTWSESAFVARSGQHIALENLGLPLSVRTGRPPRMLHISSLLNALPARASAQDHIAPLRIDWFDLGYGVPPHPVRRRGNTPPNA